MSSLRRKRLGERYHHSTEGVNAQGFMGVDDPVLYSVLPTVKDFSKADPIGIEGQIGIYYKDGTLVTGALVAGDIFQFVQKNSDGSLKKSTLFAFDDSRFRKEPYQSAFIQQHAIGYDGTSGSLNIAIVGGLQEFVLIVKDKSSNNQPFPTMEGRAIVRGGSPSIYDIAANIVRSGANSFDHEKNGDVPFSIWEVLTDITGTLPGAATSYTKIGGTNQITAIGANESASGTGLAVAGNYFVDNSSSNPTKNIIAKIISSSFDGADTVIELDYKNAVFQSGNLAPTVRTIVTADAMYAVEADLVAAQFGISITGTTYNTYMDVVISEDLSDATVTKGDWRQGKGESWLVANMEDETIVFDGFTTGNEAWPGDFGFPDLWIEAGSLLNYDLFFIDGLNRIIPSAGTPQNQTLMLAHLWAPAVAGSDLATNYDTIFTL